MLDRILVPVKVNTPDQIAATVKKILIAGVQKIKYDAAKTYLTVLRELSPEEISTPIEKILYQIFGSVEAYEFILGAEGTKTFADILIKIDQQNLKSSYILCHSKSAFLKAIGVQGSIQKTIFGIPIFQNDEVPADKFLLFITKEKDCQPEDTILVNIVHYESK